MKDKRLIIEVGSPYTLEILKDLLGSSVYEQIWVLSSTHGEQQRIQNLFSDSRLKYLNLMQVLQSPYEISISENTVVQDGSIEQLIEFQGFFDQFLLQTDRLSLTDHSVFKMQGLFNRIGQFWLGFLRTHAISTCIFFHTPHLGVDFLLYAAARTLKIKIIICNPTAIGNYTRLLAGIDLRSSGKVELWTLGNEVTFNTDENDTRNFHYEWNASVNTGALMSIKKYNAFQRLKDLFYFIKLSAQRKRYLHMSNFWLERDKGFIRLLMGIISHQYKRELAIKKYNTIAKDFGHPSSYVLFVANYQPERTSVPEGGVFGDIFTSLVALRKWVPAEIPILFKEHPSQFGRRNLRAMKMRSVEFYEGLKSLPNVRFVPLDSPSDAFIQGASLVATINGTAGWEALQKGVPVVTFGDTYYNPCQSVLHVSCFDTMPYSDFIQCNGVDMVQGNLFKFKKFVKKHYLPYCTIEYFYRKAPGLINIHPKGLASCILEVEHIEHPMII